MSPPPCRAKVAQTPGRARVRHWTGSVSELESILQGQGRSRLRSRWKCVDSAGLPTLRPAAGGDSVHLPIYKHQKLASNIDFLKGRRFVT